MKGGIIMTDFTFVIGGLVDFDKAAEDYRREAVLHMYVGGGAENG